MVMFRPPWPPRCGGTPQIHGKQSAFHVESRARQQGCRETLDKLTGQDPNSAYVTTLEVERQINTFFRLTSATVIAKLREAFPDLPEKPDQRTVFLKLRELRNSW